MTKISFKRDFIQNAPFKQAFFSLVIPTIIQISITSLVNMLDDIMVGSLGTAGVSGVAVSNQLLFIYNFAVFGILSGTGIFGAQFYGAKNYKGVRDVFRAKVLFSSAMFALGAFVLLGFTDGLIGNYLKGKGDALLADDILKNAKSYLHIMLIGLPIVTLSQCYAGSMRESGDMHVPMRAGVIAIIVNLIGNYLLIFGHLGFPEMGVRGAAIATVISRIVELIYLMYFAHGTKKYEFFKGAYRTLKVPYSLLVSMLKKGLPLVVNELLWSMSITQLNQIYSLRGLIVMAAINIAQTAINLFNIILRAIGDATAVIVGQRLGAGETEKAKKDANILMMVTFVFQMGIAVLMVIASRFFPEFYNVENEVKRLASAFIFAMAIASPLNAVTLVSYFALRAGGKTFITFITDSVFNWAVLVSFSFILVRFTDLDITTIYILNGLGAALKCLVGVIFLKKSDWAKRIVEK